MSTQRNGHLSATLRTGSSVASTSALGCSECAWGKVAGCWRCGSRATPPHIALRDFLRSLPHAEIARGSDRWIELRADIRREADACDAEDAAQGSDE